MELLQFAYFCRRLGAVIGIDPVAEMRAASATNLKLAESRNDWLDASFVELREGDALALPVADASIDLAAQNCLFNVFEDQELHQVIAEMYRVLKPHGRLVMSDPTCEANIPAALRAEERLRALCLSGAIPLASYIKCLTYAGFGTIEVRARRPYRVLDKQHYAVAENILVESVEVCAIKDPMPDDGSCVFTGCTAIYLGNDELFDDGKGHVLSYNQPLSICDKTAAAMQALGKKTLGKMTLGRDDLYITGSTYFYDGGGCC